jgi:hypothetical protein
MNRRLRRLGTLALALFMALAVVAAWRAAGG